MIGFLLKKTFYDLWDNLFRLVLVNLGFILSAAIPFALPMFLEHMPILGIVLLVGGVLWLSIYLAATAIVVKEISDYKSFGFAEFFAAIPHAVVPGLAFAGLGVLVWLLGSTAIPFYLKMGNLVGLFAASLVFWTLVVVILALQFFLTIQARLDRRLLKGLKKSFIIFFDNPGLCVFSFLHNVVVLAISFFLAFLAPGPAGILLFMDEALRLRLLKYDWLEAHPEADRKKIPWDELLEEEREKTGTRSLRSFIFPWKD
ncbi:MAG TPA: hypothetical protein PLW34_10140 [Termitinemataceae bacterium]|nr:hypothetical protein [Termitinemataceae bacterium]HPQ01200.1 hypothetical protein [Termitinemataceae bacterium]